MTVKIKIKDVLKSNYLNLRYTHAAADMAYGNGRKSVPLYFKNKCIGQLDVDYEFPTCAFSGEISDTELNQVLSEADTRKSISFEPFGIQRTNDEGFIVDSDLHGVQVVPAVVSSSNTIFEVK